MQGEDLTYVVQNLMNRLQDLEQRSAKGFVATTGYVTIGATGILAAGTDILTLNWTPDPTRLYIITAFARLLSTIAAATVQITIRDQVNVGLVPSAATVQTSGAGASASLQSWTKATQFVAGARADKMTAFVTGGSGSTTGAGYIEVYDAGPA
jgi:hypothetical protein